MPLILPIWVASYWFSRSFSIRFSLSNVWIFCSRWLSLCSMRAGSFRRILLPSLARQTPCNRASRKTKGFDMPCSCNFLFQQIFNLLSVIMWPHWRLEQCICHISRGKIGKEIDLIVSLGISMNKKKFIQLFKHKAIFLYKKFKNLKLEEFACFKKDGKRQRLQDVIGTLE